MKANTEIKQSNIRNPKQKSNNESETQYIVPQGAFGNDQHYLHFVMDSLLLSLAPERSNMNPMFNYSSTPPMQNQHPTYKQILYKYIAIQTSTQQSIFHHLCNYQSSHTYATTKLHTPTQPPIFNHLRNLQCSHTHATPNLHTPTQPPIFKHLRNR